MDVKKVRESVFILLSAIRSAVLVFDATEFQA